MKAIISLFNFVAGILNLYIFLTIGNPINAFCSGVSLTTAFWYYLLLED